MSKYKPTELRKMAIAALEAKRRGDFEYTQLILTLCIRTGFSADAVERRIQSLANGGKR